MTPEKPHDGEGNTERVEKSHLTPPALELLLDTGEAVVWPEKIKNDVEFVKQREERKQLINNLERVTDRLPRPDVSLQNAVAEKIISEPEVATLYESLQKLLEETDYGRALLYIPFEFLPKSTWSAETT